MTRRGSRKFAPGLREVPASVLLVAAHTISNPWACNFHKARCIHPETASGDVYAREDAIVTLLKRCAKQKDLKKGSRIHADITRIGWLQKSAYVASSVVSMYAKCGAFQKAEQVLHELHGRGVVAWNALIAGYAQQGRSEEALSCMDNMVRNGLSPNAVTFTCALQACGSIAAANRGEKLYEEIVKRQLLEKDVVLGNALVDMFVKCGALAKAAQVLNELPVRNVVSWTTLIAGYVQHDIGEAALICMEQMQQDNLVPNAITFACALQACGLIGAADKGEQIHRTIVEQWLLEKDLILGTALVDMYIRCGKLNRAQEVILELPVRDVCLWTALIAGYAQQGKSREALSCYDRMQNEGHSPDAATFACVLNACSHSGLLVKGQTYFTEMTAMYGITPDADHVCCMVDLFARAGEFDKALALIQNLPPGDHHLCVWLALLSACRKWKNVEVGKLAFDNAIYIDKHRAAAYVLMSNLFIDLGMYEAANEIEIMRLRNKAWNQI